MMWSYERRPMDKIKLQAPPVMTEGEIQALVEQAFRLAGWLVFHTRDSPRSEPGFPDIVAVKAPWVVFAELKASSGKVKARAARSTRRELPTQADWLASLWGCPGVETYVWRPEDWELILQVANRPPWEQRKQEIMPLTIMGPGHPPRLRAHPRRDLGLCARCGEPAEPWPDLAALDPAEATRQAKAEGVSVLRFKTMPLCPACREAVHPEEPEQMDIPPPTPGCEHCLLAWLQYKAVWDHDLEGGCERCPNDCLEDVMASVSLAS